MATVIEIRTLREFEKLEADWRRLHSGLRHPSVFLSYPWFQLCMKHLLPGQFPLILVVHEGQQVIGIAPLVQQPIRVRGLPLRQIGFLINPITAFTDFLLLEPEVGLPLILQHLLRVRTDWDLISFSKLRQDSSSLPLLERALANSRHPVSKRELVRTPFLRMDVSWEEFYRSKSRKFRMTRRSVANRLQRLGSLCSQQITGGPELDAGLRDLFAVSARSWKRAQGKDLLSPEFEKNFLSELSEIAAREGWLSLWLLKKDNDVLAAEYHLNDNGIAYGLRAHYDEAYSAYSPGRYLDYEIVEQLFRNGCSGYDMGPVAADYKMAWTDSTYSCYIVDIFKRSVYSRLVYQLEHVWIPALKNLKQIKPPQWLKKRVDSLQPRK